MTKRNTIRPVTLKRVIETCSIATKTGLLDTTIISRELSVSSDRAKEIILELELMGLLTNREKEYFPNNNTNEFLEYFENEHWNKIHEYFNTNYRFYHDYIKILQSSISDKGLTLIEIKDASIEEKLSLNQTAVEVLSDWCERLGVTQRHLFTRRIYLSKNCSLTENSKIFKEILLEYYREFSNSNHRRGIFMEIPTLREDICEKLSISRKSFDEMLRNLFLENIGKIELSGAPITTLAKKSPLSEKKMVIQGKDAILSPKFEAAKEREGLIVGQKAYYYMAIHESI